MSPAARSISTQLRRAPTRYKPIARLAAGGMAEVWRAEALFEDGSAHPVAIKRVLPDLGASERERALFRAMFEDEARLGQLLRHDNVVHVHDARDVGGTLIMVMELVDGDTLKGLIEPAWERGVGMPLPSALYVAEQLCRGLAYVHDLRGSDGLPLGIVHRDVSPHNLLLGRDGGVKLTDFGLADARVNEAARSDDLIGGKLGYLAPELVLQKGTDQRIDSFAAAICLWEMLAGRRLFQGRDDGETVRNVARCEVPSLRTIRRDVPDEVDRFVQTSLSPDPDARPSSGAMADALAALVQRHGKGVSATDVALMVGLHVARRDREKQSPSVVELGLAELLASELEDFVLQQRGGEAPLDPREFELGLTGGARPKVRAPRGDFDD
ncbi:MAG: serine/threonine protein kinase [Sandaracinus sp.]|nr:serine/threonine protein kinase [Sandaracinus sp.]MCB9618685.1 serine/threonine protein kinase [Sandaracinus sp.]MCB9632616.1 serine/threonine protein kinase [Sandaracinus sp.]